MYTIELTNYGMKHTFYGVLDGREMEKWLTDSEKLLEELDTSFNMLVDMQDVKPLGEQVEEILYEGTKLIGRHGLNRGAVLMNNPEVSRQMRQIAKYANLHRQERYIDTFTNRNWEQLARDWVERGIDPDRA